ncbi:MAG: hypothetical protein JWN14_4362 [Chthonomonadales bacterium]|nr:hypothetical protein [Chthonomonadales bacterium]
MTSRRRFLKVCGWSCAAAIGVLLWIGWCLWSLERSFDLSTNPPDKAFTKVFAIPPPASADEIKVAGYMTLNGDAWIRLHVNDVDAALVELKRSRVGVTGPDKEYDKNFEEEMDNHNPSSPMCKHAVGWEELKHVKHPEFYYFPALFNGSGLRGVLVVDRQRKLLFVEAQLF